MAGLTIANIFGPVSIGDRYMSVNTVAFDSSYPVGGESLTPAQLGFKASGDPSFHLVIEDHSGFRFEYDYTNHKILVKTALKKYTATVDPASLATVTARDETITVTGVKSGDLCVGLRGPDALESKYVIKGGRVSADDTIIARVDNPSAASIDPASGTWTFFVSKANGAATEVADTTDLSGLTGVRVTAYGKLI